MLATQEAVDHVRNCGEPIVIEAKCYRFPHHAGPIPGSAYGYRTKEEEKQWQQQDPYITFSKELIDNGIFSVDQIERLQTKAVNVVKSAAAHCATSKDDKFFVREELWPKPASLLTGLRGDGKEFNGITFNEREDFSRFESRTYVEAIAAVTGKHLEKDERVFVLGEEVASFGGGPYSATKGLPAKYPARVMNTPISECGFSGLAGGAAACGLRPIVEIMFPDFALVAADQLFNQIGKLRHIYGNSVEMPIVVRTRIAIGCGYGGQHSMDPVGQYSLWSGWRILAPSSAFDYIGLFNSAMQCNDPVLIVEHNGLYALKSEVPENNLDYFVQMGKARVVRSGRDITILCYSSTVMLVEKVAKDLEEAEGISVEIIDLRTLSFADIDYETIGESLKKTGVLATVEQAPSSMSIGPVIACQCQKRFFDYFDAPPVTIAGADIPIPVSKVLEAAAVPTFESVREMIRKAVRRES
jgi:2-oxoisovalerate dehydrogenase E1 component